jgi:hypothetical protein
LSSDEDDLDIMGPDTLPIMDELNTVKAFGMLSLQVVEDLADASSSTAQTSNVTSTNSSGAVVPLPAQQA